MVNKIHMNSGPDWGSVDWNKTNTTISNELGCPVVVVSYYRSEVGRPRVLGSTLDWESLDWSKNDAQLSQENKVSVYRVRFARRVLGHPPVNGADNRRVVTKEMIDSVDWVTTRDSSIARHWHVSRERVRQIRQEQGFPVCELNSRDTMSSEFERWMISNSEFIEGKIASEVAELGPVGLSVERKYQLMRKGNIPFIWKQVRTSEAVVVPINWDLPNLLIDAIWNKCQNWSSNNRARYSKGPIKWKHTVHGYGNVGIKGMVSMYPELEKSVRDEISKAISLGRYPNWNKLEAYGIKELEVVL